MAREPEKTSNDDKAKPTGAPSKEDLKTEQDKAPPNTQNEPYPTGNPPPARDHLGRPVDKDGKVIEEK